MVEKIENRQVSVLVYPLGCLIGWKVTSHWLLATSRPTHCHISSLLMWCVIINGPLYALQVDTSTHDICFVFTKDHS